MGCYQSTLASITFFHTIAKIGNTSEKKKIEQTHLSQRRRSFWNKERRCRYMSCSQTYALYTHTYPLSIPNPPRNITPTVRLLALLKKKEDGWRTTESHKRERTHLPLIHHRGSVESLSHNSIQLSTTQLNSTLLRCSCWCFTSYCQRPKLTR